MDWILYLRARKTGLSLVIQAFQRHQLSSTFSFYALPGNRRVPPGSFTMTGTYSATRLTLMRNQWISHPAGYNMINLYARLPAPGGTVLSGQANAPGLPEGCTTFTVAKFASSGPR